MPIATPTRERPAAAPVAARRSVLVTGARRDEFQRVAPLLRRTAFDVDWFPRAEGALGLLSQVSVDLLLVRYPTRGIPCRDFLKMLRQRDCASRSSPLVLLADRDAMGEAESLVGHGANQVLALACSREQLEATASRLLDVAPRRATRLPTRLEVQLGGPDATLAFTHNISATGMLVEASARYVRGQRLRFEFMEGHRPIAGVAEVIRHTRPEVETIEGYGLRLVDFRGDSHHRYLAFLDRLLQARRAGA